MMSNPTREIQTVEDTYLNRPAPTTLFVAVYVAAFIISKYVGFSLGYALDDYVVISNTTTDPLIGQFIAQGRFSFAALEYLLAATTLSMSDFHTVALLGTAGCGGLMFASMLRVSDNDNRLMLVSIAAMLGAHPYYAEYVTFRQAALPMALMFMFLWLSFNSYTTWSKLRFRGYTRPAVAVACAVIATGLNQLALPFLCMGLLIFNARLVAENDGQLRSQWWRPFLVAAGGGLAVAIPYLVFAYGIRKICGLPADARMVMLASANIPHRLDQIFNLFFTLLAGDESIASANAKSAVLLGAVAAGVCTSIARLRNAGYALLIFIAAMGLALLPVAISGPWWPMPRTLIAVPMAFAGAILLLSDGQTQFLSRISFVALLIASLLFAANSSSVLTSQLRLNRWDLGAARDIFAATSQRFPETTGGIVLSTPRWAYPAAPKMPNGDLNVSALSVGWAVGPLFKEATGRAVKVRISTDLQDECISKGTFPSGTSVFPRGGEIVVCM